ncbi:hypothetical protein LTR72_010992 [Exophiala xenobiotica]|nr:hypothetical protein LTR72_010992 [Exophiala xenobiotica]
MLDGLSISTAPLASPTATLYSSPSPPYSGGPSPSGSSAGLSGYISSRESTTRRPTRDEKESPGLRKRLPSIHEALGDRSMSLPDALSALSQQQPSSTPTMTVGQSLIEGLKGPAHRFFPAFRSSTACSHRSIISNSKTASGLEKPPLISVDPRQPVSQPFSYSSSPRCHSASASRAPLLANTSSTNHGVHPSATSPQVYDLSSSRIPSLNLTDPHCPTGLVRTNRYNSARAGAKSDLQRPSYPSAEDVQFGATVKRHLDVSDAELGFNEINEASARTPDFARTWTQRYHHGSQSGNFHEPLPSLSEMDDALRHPHRIFENLTHLRESVIPGQTTLSEDCARPAAEYHGPSDRYRNQGLVKRRKRKPKKQRREVSTAAMF